MDPGWSRKYKEIEESYHKFYAIADNSGKTSMPFCDFVMSAMNRSPWLILVTRGSRRYGVSVLAPGLNNVLK